jgi:nifR3 family TIM-barrel protein
MVEEDGDLLDINMGCPVKKVVRCGSGSAFLRTPETIGRIVAAVRRATTRPLTIKIRTGWDQQSINFLEIAHIAENEGADAVTLHPRSRCQGFSGLADWQQIRRLKESIRIPVIGSGDIFTAADALKMRQLTGCDGVMIGRGGYGNPWLIRDTQALLSGTAASPPPTSVERLEVAMYHLQLFTRTYGPRRALLDMRKHLCWYSRGLEGAAAYRLAVNGAQSSNELQQITSDFFQSSLVLTGTNHREPTT